MKQESNQAEYFNIKTFEEALCLAKKSGVNIFNEGDFVALRGPSKGVGIAINSHRFGVLVNLTNTSYEKGICIESLSESLKEIYSTYYEWGNTEFILREESNYQLIPFMRNIELRKDIWKLNSDGTLSEEWKKSAGGVLI